MLTPEQVSQSSKERVVELLSSGGVNMDSLKVCIFGLAHESITSGLHKDWDIERAEFNSLSYDDQMSLAARVAEEARSDFKGYAALALTIYGRYIADKFVHELSGQLEL